MFTFQTSVLKEEVNVLPSSQKTFYFWNTLKSCFVLFFLNTLAPQLSPDRLVVTFDVWTLKTSWQKTAVSLSPSSTVLLICVGLVLLASFVIIHKKTITAQSSGIRWDSSRSVFCHIVELKKCLGFFYFSVEFFKNGLSVWTQSQSWPRQVSWSGFVFQVTFTPSEFLLVAVFSGWCDASMLRCFVFY